MKETVIGVYGVKKRYRLGQINRGTLNADLQSWWARIRGKEDPNLPIDTDLRLIGQEFMALNGVTFEVSKGECLGIIGRNGAGKSTLLKLLCRITAPTEGEIGLTGRVTSMLEVGTGFNPEMTGRENVYLNGAILGMTTAEIDSKLEQIIEFSECADFIDTPVKRYSSGMYVKLAFSVSTFLDSDIMIMDEVLAVGDVNFQKKCIDRLMNVVNDSNKTVLFVSHNMASIRKLCDRCIVLDGGRIIYDGNAEKAIALYTGSGNDNETSRDLSAHVRSGIPFPMVLMERISYENDRPVFDERAKMVVRLRALEDFEDAAIRIILRELTYEPIGMFYSEEKISMKKGEIKDQHFELDLSSLAEGKYTFDIMVGKLNGGQTINYDSIPNVMTFSKTQSADSIVWAKQTWGSVRFPYIKLN